MRQARLPIQVNIRTYCTPQQETRQIYWSSVNIVPRHSARAYGTGRSDQGKRSSEARR